MKKLTYFLFYLIAGIGVVSAQTQVTGTVISADDGDTVIGASVVVKGATGTGTVTNMNGAFTLNVPAGATTLIVSYIGMITQEVAIAPNMRILLRTDSKQLDEVVVVGYGTQSARSVTSSISSVKADAIRDVPNVSFDQTLQGRATGIQITTPAGIVGQPPIVRVRGVNSITSGTSPLYVVNGVPILSGDIARDGQYNALADINPADILTIDILKDAAAAALYGSRAANGVILITTKTGSRDRVKVTYDGYVGFTTPTNFIKVMNAQEYVDFKNMGVKNRYGTDEMTLTTGYTSPWGNKAYNMMKDGNGQPVDTDWSKSVFQTGTTHNHTVSVSGGSPKATYYFSGNYADQIGMVKGDTYSRFGVQANTTVNATDWLKLSGNMNVSTGKTAATDAARSGSNFAVGGFPRMALINSPNIPMYNDDGTPYFITSGLGYGPNTIASTYSNPAQLLEQGNGRTTEVFRMIANFSAEIKLLPRMTYKTLYGKDYTRTSDERFWSPLHGDGVNYVGYGLGTTGLTDKWIWTNTLNYNFNFDKNNFNLLAGMEVNETNFNGYGIARQNLTDLKYTFVQGPYLTNNSAGMSMSSNSLVSYFGRINYDFDGKYLLSLNLRRDGYSALGANNRWGNFGGVSAGWIVSDEAFFQPLTDVVSLLKFKGSWGIVGNTNIDNYAAKSYYGSGYYGNNSYYLPSSIGDPNLKWETSKKTDIGFDATLFDRVNIEFDYYYTKTDDLILAIPQAPSKGFPGSLYANAGQIENKGIEINVSADIVKKRDFTWNSSFNITTNANKVLKLADGVEEILGGDASALEVTNKTVVGKSIGQLFVAQTRGIDAATGRRIFVTNSGEEVLIYFEKSAYYYRNDPEKLYGSSASGISTADYAISGNTLPTYYGGWNNSFRYKGFDANIFIQFSGGNNVLNGTKATCADQRYWNNAKELIAKSWTPGKTDAIYAYPIYADNISNGSAHPISDWIEKGDYIRFKNVSVGYTFDSMPFLTKAGITSIRVYALAQNLLTITKYTGLDPEALTNVNNYNRAGGTDKNTMPQAKVLTLGLNLTF